VKSESSSEEALELSRYVHLNPVRIKSKMAGEILQYRWSSLPGYIDEKRQESWVMYEAVLGYVGGSRQKYGEFVQDGIRQGFATPWEVLLAQMVLGGPEFHRKTKRNEEWRDHGQR
jgi:hypothetical protein